MKSEERHKLQHNVLADWIAKSIKAVQPHLNSIAVGVLAVLLAVTGYYAWTKMSAASSQQSWDEFNAALGKSDVTMFTEVTTGFPKSKAAYAAALVAGDMHLAQGCEQLFTNKAVGNQELTKAVESYETVLAGSGESSLRERATYGLARAREAKGELDAAVELYQSITTKWAKGTYAVAAAKRMKDLKEPATKAFYDRFAKFNPKPAFSSDTGDKPAFDQSLPSEPGPAAGGDIKFDGGKSITPTGGDKPAETKPADAKPAETAPPADAGK